MLAIGTIKGDIKMYKLIKGNLTTFVENLNELPESNIISFCCSNDGSLLVALVKVTKEAIENEVKAKEAKKQTEKDAKAKALEAERVAKKAKLKEELAKLEDIKEEPEEIAKE